MSTEKWLFVSSFLIEKAFIGNKNLARFILFGGMNYETDGKWQEKEFSLPLYEIQSLLARSEAEPRVSSANWDKPPKTDLYLTFSWHML